MKRIALVVLTPEPMKKTYSTIEAARLLGLSVQTVQRCVDLGQLQAWKTPGGHRRIDADSVDGLIRERGAPRGAAAAANGSAHAGTNGHASTLRVLVVDDDDNDRQLVALLVQQALPSAVIQTAASGFEALMHIGRDAPDVLVTDVMMPHMNGFEMLSHLAGTEFGRPPLIVATSSYTLSELAALGRLPEGVHFISKPIDAEALGGLLRTRQAVAAAGEADARAP